MELSGKRNAYVCPVCSGETVTVNLHDGCTPFMIRCRANWPGECKGFAQSSFYRIDQQTVPSWGWYRPKAEDVKPEEKHHVDNGGLLLRRLDPAEKEAFGQKIRRA